MTQKTNYLKKRKINYLTFRENHKLHVSEMRNTFGNT